MRVRVALLSLSLASCAALVDLSDLEGAATDASAPSDASDGGPRVVRCDPTTCEVGATECCSKCTSDASDCGRTNLCVADAAACTGTDDVLFACSDTASCPDGDVCCIDLGGSVHAPSCMTSDNCVAAGRSIMCDPSATPSACPQGLHCDDQSTPANVSLTRFQGMYVCE